MQPGDRLIVCFLEEMSSEYTFKDWPLHVTIIPWFRCNEPNSTVLAELNTLLNRFKSFEFNLNGQARFGNNKTVSLIDLPSPFLDLERAIRGMLKIYNSWIVDETTKKPRSFRPHVTWQKNSTPAHKSYGCHSLYLVEQLGSQKKVVGKVNLDG